MLRCAQYHCRRDKAGRRVRCFLRILHENTGKGPINVYELGILSREDTQPERGGRI